MKNGINNKKINAVSSKCEKTNTLIKEDIQTCTFVHFLPSYIIFLPNISTLPLSCQYKYFLNPLNHLCVLFCLLWLLTQSDNCSQLGKKNHCVLWLRDKLYTAVPHYDSPQSFFWRWTAAQKTSSSAIVWCSSCGVFLSLHWVQAVAFVCACNLLRLFVCFVLWMLVGFCMWCLFSFFLSFFSVVCWGFKLFGFVSALRARCYTFQAHCLPSHLRLNS